MNKIFKVVWNRTIQSFVVTSELAKGRVKSSAEQNSTDVSAESGKNGIATVFRLTVISAALFGASNAYAATAQVGRIEVDNTTSATAISGATATGVGALGVGLTAQANQGNAIAIGNSAQAQTGNTIAIGKDAVANSPASGSAPSSAIALGADANATGFGTIAIGRASEVLSQNSMNVNVTHNNIAIGNTARVGDSSSSKITQSIAIGSGNRVDKQGRPEGAWAKGDQSIAVGGNVLANGNSSVAIGGDDLDAVGGTRYSGNATDKFINYNEKGAKTGEYTLSGKSLRDIYKEMTGDTMNYGSYGNTIAGQGSVALGVQSNSSADLSLAIGTKSQATAFGGVALGTGAKATLLNSVALGTASKTDKEGKAYVQREIMGETYTWAGGATTDAGDVVSVGSKGYERQIINVSPGDISATSTDAINGSQLYGVLSAIERVRYFSVKSEEGKTDGTKNWNNDGAKATNSIAIGPNAATSTGATGSVSLGHNANVLGEDSVAVGPNATVTSRTVGAVALGSNANSRGTGSIAIGLNTENNYNYSVVVGAHSRANYGNATVVGARAAAQNNGTAMGYLSNAVGDDSVAIGHQAQTTQAYSIAIGKQANSSGLYSTAIGSSAQAAGQNSFAGGNNAKATGSDSVALGSGATTTIGSSVALGNGAVGTANNFDATAKNATFKNDSGAVTNVSYAASSSAKTGAVSVGSAGNERQIQNVAAGRISATSTDAVNGSQLYTVMNNVGHNIQQNGTDKSRINNNGTVNYADGNLTTVAITDGENASKVQINVTQGTLSVDNNGTVSAPTAGVATAGDVANAINNAKTTTKVEAGSNAHVNKTTSGKETTYTVSADKATVQVSNALNLTSNTTTAADGAVTTEYSIDLAQSTKDNIQKGVDAKTTVDTKGLTFNGDSGSTNVEKLGSTVTVAGDDNITTEAQDDKVTVKLNKDLVVDSVKAGDTTVNNDGVKVGDDVALTQDGVKAGDVKLTKDGLNNAGNKVTNVAAGTEDTDAVNYGQLKETNANVAKGLNIAADNGNDDNVQLGETVAYRSSDKNIVTTVSDNQIDFKLAKDITVDSVTAGDSKLNSDGLTITGGPSVTKSGINAAGNKITNVAPGTDDTDAVNYSQLKQQSAAARTEVAAGTNIKDVVKTTGANGQDIYTVNAKGTTASAGSDKVTVTASAEDANNVTDYSIDLAQDTKDDIQKGVDAKTTVDTKGLTFNGDSGSTNVEKLGSTVTVAGDDNITTEAQDDKVTVKLNKDLVVDSVKAGDTTVNNDGVKVGDDVALTQDGVKAGDVKLTKDGLNNAGKKVTNVADGDLNANSKDAVNGSQLFATNQNVANNAANIAKGINFGGTTGSNNYALGDTINVKGDSNIISETVAGGAQLKLAKDITVDSVTAGDSKLNSDGLTITGGPSVTKSGINAAGNKITNVAPGTDDTDAVNYSQLKQQSAAARTEVAAGTNIKDVVKTTGANGQDIYTVNAKGTTASAGSDKVTVTASAEDANNVTDYSIDLAQDTKDDIQKGVDAKTAVDNKGLTFNGDSGSTNIEKLGSTVTVAGDDNITTEAQDDKVTVKLNKDLVVDSVKAGDTTVNNDGVKVGDDVALTQDGVKAGDVKLTKDGLNNAGNKVTNVAAGTEDTDAVNYGQLKETNANVAKGLNIAADNGNDDNVQLGETVAYRSSDKNIVTTVSDNQIDFKLAKDITVDSVTAGDSKLNSDGLTITGGPSVTKSGINAAGNKITNVAPGTDDTDAVNYSQLKQQSAAARTEVAAGTNIKDVVKTTGANGQDIYTVNAKGTTASAGSDKVTVTASAEDANNVTDYSIDLAQDTKDDIQKGVDAKTAVDNKGLTFNGDSGSTNVEKLGSTVTVAGDDNITTEAQDDKVTVKLNKDLVVDSVKAGDTTVNNDGVKVGDDVALTQDGVKAGDVKLTKDGLNNAGNKVTNVAAGTEDTDAVNYGQLKETNANVAKGLNIAADNGNDDNVQLGETVAYRSSDKNIVTTVSDNQIDFKLAKDITVDSVTAGDSKLNSDGLTITGGPSVTKSGINAAGNKITNVAPGTDDTDAVNYSQLKQQSAAARTEVAAGTNIKDVVKTTGANGQDIYTVNAKGTTASAGSDKVTVTASAEDANNVTDYSIDLAQDTKDDIQKGVDAKTTVDNKGLTFNGDSGSTNIEKLGSTVTVAGDDNITTEAQDDKVTVKLNKDLVVDSVKAGDTTVNNDGVKVGDDVALTQDGVKAGDVKLTKDGLNNAGKKVTNVADGDLNANSKDAVNGSQLFATNQNVANNAANIAKGINFGGTTGSNNYALGDTINVKGDSNIISETVAGGAQLKLADVLNVGQAAPVKIDGDKGEVSGLSNTTLGGSDFAQGKRAATEEQLNAAQDQLVNVLGGNAANNGGNISMTDIGGTGENNIHDAIKAVNATANLPLTFGGDSGKDVERKPGTKLNIVGGQTDAAKLSDGNIGVVANGSDKLEVKLAKDLAVDSVKAGDTTVNTDGVKVGDVNLTKAGLNNGGNKITNVAAGTDDTDAVNVAQLNKAAAAAKTEVVQGDNIVVTQDVGANGQTIYKVATDKNLKVDSVTAGDTVMNNDGVKVGDDVGLNKDGLKAGDVNLTKAGLNNGGNKITNVAAGTDDTDAVNVSQLKQAAAASKTEVVQGKNIVVTEKTGDKGQTVYEIATDKDLDVDSVKAGDTTVNNDGVKVGDNVALNKDGLKAGDVNLTKDGLDNAGNKVTNVADGDLNANSKDAVNGSQLYATNQNVANNAATIAKGINFGGTTGSNNYALGNTINVKGDSNIISETVAGGAQLKLADEISVKTVNADTFKAGDTVMNNDGVKVSDKVALNKDGLTAGNTVVNNDGVTIAAPTESNPNNQVKLSPVGLNNGGQRITNVAPGKDGTDAANVNQLIGLGNELQNNINQVGKKAYAGVAGAIAQGSIPQVTRPGATGIGVGSGYYGGQSAMAIGVSAMSDGGNWIVKGNFSANTDGHVGVGAGALYQW